MAPRFVGLSPLAHGASALGVPRLPERALGAGTYIVSDGSHPNLRGRTYLGPGDLVVRSEPDVLFTVLGSCVSVCLWDAEHRVAGMNHFVFPRATLWDRGGPRIGGDAIHGLTAMMQRMGAVLSCTTAKLFGAARIPGAVSDARSISAQNVQVAGDVLDDLGIRVVASDLGGHHGRKVLLDTGTGDVWMKYLIGASDD